MFRIKQFFSDFILAIKCYGTAFLYIYRKRYYWYIFLPAVIMMLLYFVGRKIQYHAVQPKVNSLNDLTWIILSLIIEVSLALLFMRFAKYLVVAALSPLLSKISRDVEFELTGNKYPTTWSQSVHDIQRGFRIAFRNILWEYAFFAIVYLAAWIGWGSTSHHPLLFLVFIIGFYYYGFSFVDYINERLKLDLPSSVKLMRNHRGLALGVGSIYSCLIWMPVDLDAIFNWSNFAQKPLTFLFQFCMNIGFWLTASFAPVLAIVAATFTMHKRFDLKKMNKSETILKDLNIR